MAQNFSHRRLRNESSESETGSSSFEDGEEYDTEEDLTLMSIQKSHTVNFQLRASYTSWGPSQAFRELVQNWRDGVIKSYNLRENQFLVFREERSKGRDTDIVYKIWRPNSEPKRWLGYIGYSGRDGLGTIEITNRNAVLQPAHLDMGGTEKAHDKIQAGAHGEGLKLALLVLQRGEQNHSVRCHTGAFTWNFNFTNCGKLVARLRRMTPDQLQRAQAKNHSQKEKTLMPFAPRPERDVQFLIGQRASGRNEFGLKIKRDLVGLDDFNKWCKVALFLQDIKDDGIVRCTRGDLITDPQLRGNIYPKGLLLKESTPENSASITGKPLKFGYNFQQGITNRERQSVANAWQESEAYSAIWNEVLIVRPGHISLLSEMLNSDPCYADVSMAKLTMHKATIAASRKHLFEDKTKWFYTAEEKSQNPELDKIICGLGREGIQLQNLPWSLLERDKGIRTAEQEQKCRFLAAESISVPDSPFATEIDRLIRACMQGCPQMAEMTVQFIKAGQLCLHTYFLEEEEVFEVHERWLNYTEVTEELGLRSDLDELDVLFHGVKRLFGDMLQQISTDNFDGDDHDHPALWYKRRAQSSAEQRLLEYIRLKKLCLLGNPECSAFSSSSLGLSYGRLDDANMPQDDSELQIQLHHVSSCWHLKRLLTTTSQRSLPLMTAFHNTLTAKLCAVMNSFLPCVTSEVAPGVSQRRTPKCHQNPHSGGNRFTCLQPGKEYFAVLYNVVDLESILVISNTCATSGPFDDGPTTSMPGFTEPVIPLVDLKSETRDTPGSLYRPFSIETTDSDYAGASRESSPFAAPSANDLPFNGTQEMSNLDDTYTLGRPVENLNILTPRCWYEALDSPAGSVVIGIVKDDQEMNDLQDTGRPRKRQYTQRST
ncbi:hypothetical protein G7046_g2127 [Stylonectria norvegica]|nr:hypothetical protein G7046_g2127 [Stylonectria norvegica]